MNNIEVVLGVWTLAVVIASLEVALSGRRLFAGKKELDKECKINRQAYVAAMKDVYNLMTLQLQYRDRWSDPDVLAAFDAIDKTQKTLYDRIMKLELVECGIVFEGTMKAPQ